MKRSFFFSIIAGAGLVSCSLHFTPSVTAERLPVSANDTSAEESNQMSRYIAPYKQTMDSCMNKPVSFCKTDLEHFRGRSPMALLLMGQLEIIARNQLPQIGKDEIMTVFNTGGIRSGLQNGVVTVGDVYSILPFDNQLIFLRLTEENQEAILSLNRSNAKLLFGGDTLIGDAGEHTWLVATDFVVNGGDRFQLPETVDRSDIINSGLIRDLVIEAFSKVDTLKPVR